MKILIESFKKKKKKKKNDYSIDMYGALDVRLFPKKLCEFN